MRISRFTDSGEGAPYRDSLDRDPLDKDSPGQRSLGQRPLDKDLPGQRPSICKNSGTRDREPLEGTCDQVATQEVTSYRDHLQWT